MSDISKRKSSIFQESRVIVKGKKNGNKAQTVDEVDRARACANT